MPKIRYYIRAKSREGKTIFLLVTWCFNRERIAWTTKINDKKWDIATGLLNLLKIVKKNINAYYVLIEKDM